MNLTWIMPLGQWTTFFELNSMFNYWSISRIKQGSIPVTQENSYFKNLMTVKSKRKPLKLLLTKRHSWTIPNAKKNIK